MVPQGVGERGKREKGKEGGGVHVCVCYLDQSPPRILPVSNSLAQLRAATAKSKVLESWMGIGTQQS